MSRQKDWQNELNVAVNEAVGNLANERGYIDANVTAVKRTLKGQGPDEDTCPPGAGARMVVNIASAHVPAFANANDFNSYKNYYDLGRHIVGDNEPTKIRELVDMALPVQNYKNITSVRLKSE